MDLHELDQIVSDIVFDYNQNIDDERIIGITIKECKSDRAVLTIHSNDSIPDREIVISESFRQGWGARTSWHQPINVTADNVRNIILGMICEYLHKKNVRENAYIPN